MKRFTKDYYVHNGELYKKLKPNANGCYHLTNQLGKRQWISIKKIEKLIENYPPTQPQPIPTESSTDIDW